MRIKALKSETNTAVSALRKQTDDYGLELEFTAGEGRRKKRVMFVF